MLLLLLIQHDSQRPASCPKTCPLCMPVHMLHTPVAYRTSRPTTEPPRVFHSMPDSGPHTRELRTNGANNHSSLRSRTSLAVIVPNANVSISQLAHDTAGLRHPNDTLTTKKCKGTRDNGMDFPGAGLVGQSRLRTRVVVPQRHVSSSSIYPPCSQNLLYDNDVMAGCTGACSRSLSLPRPDTE